MKQRLFIEAEWSIYAVRAKNIIESLECELNNSVPIYSSNLEGKDNFVGNWLQSKDNKSIFPNVICGAGSIVWLINGRIVDFTLNTEKLGKQTLARKMGEFIKKMT